MCLREKTSKALLTGWVGWVGGLWGRGMGSKIQKYVCLNIFKKQLSIQTHILCMDTFSKAIQTNDSNNSEE